MSGQFSFSKLVIDERRFLFYCFSESYWSKIALHKKAWSGNTSSNKETTCVFKSNLFPLTSHWALWHHAYTAWLLSYSKMAALFFNFTWGFHMVWKRFGSWNSGEWSIIVFIIIPLAKRKKVPNFAWTSPLKKAKNHKMAFSNVEKLIIDKAVYRGSKTNILHYMVLSHKIS